MSATKAAAGERAGGRAGSSSSSRAAPGRALVQPALTHQLSQICPGAGGKGEPPQPHKDDVCSPRAAAVQGCEPGEMETLLTGYSAVHPISCTDRTNRRSPA